MSSFHSIPIQDYSVPLSQPSMPEGFTVLDEKMTKGLPHKISLPGGYDLFVVVPTGLADSLRKQDPKTPVFSTDDALEPGKAWTTSRVMDVREAGCLLVLKSASTLQASWSLVPGKNQVIALTSALGQKAFLEFYVESCRIYAGSLQGAGDFGSSLKMGYRDATKAVNHYSTPVINPKVVLRLPAQFKMMSFVGTLSVAKLAPLARFKIKKQVVIK